MGTNAVPSLALLAVASMLLLCSNSNVVSAGSARISAWNILKFGDSKSRDSNVMSTILTVAKQYDLLAIQEITDAQMETFGRVLNQLNAVAGNAFDGLASPRLGRSNNKEQIGLYFRRSIWRVLASHVYDDTADDFERPPFVVKMRLGEELDIVFVCTHIRPRDAASELAALPTVVEEAKTRYGTDRVAILGDLNADCSYLSNAARDALVLRQPPYTWHIGDNIDTTLGVTKCAYDRIIGTPQFSDLVEPGSGSIYDFRAAYTLSNDAALAVSDHFPVSVVLRVSFDLNTPKYCGKLQDDTATYASIADGERIEPVCVAGYLPPSQSMSRTCLGESWGPKRSATAACFPAVWINEFHYSNSGTDKDERVEVMGPTGTDLSGYTLALYSGAQTYRNITLDLTLPVNGDNGPGGVSSVVIAVSGLQNGPGDGIALASSANNGLAGSRRLLHFISYAGSFTAADGVAKNAVSEDVGVVETSSSPAAGSIQLTGRGSRASDFTWSLLATNSFGTINTGQTIQRPCPARSLGTSSSDVVSYVTGATAKCSGERGGGGITAEERTCLANGTWSGDECPLAASGNSSNITTTTSSSAVAAALDLPSTWAAACYGAAFALFF